VNYERYVCSNDQFGHGRSTWRAAFAAALVKGLAGRGGKLAAGYPGIGRGYDAMTCAALGLNEQAVKDYIRQDKPSYTQFEAWVKKNATSLTPDAVEKHNAAVRGYIHDDETRKGILGGCGVADDASAAKDAVNLNNLDDWNEFHQAVLK
jgi:hypothetical protein